MLPFRTRPDLRERVWGGTRLTPAGSSPVGEAWLAGPASVAADGPDAGATLDQLAAKHGPALIGRDARWPDRFPFLVKVLDAREWLSVQVHPDDAQAERLEGPGAVGKTEGWFVIDAAPDAAILLGVRPGTPGTTVRDGIRAGNVASLLVRRPLSAGEAYMVPAGTLHAVGPGSLLYEIQQPSDITYRCDDWGRPPSAGRALHVEQSLAVVRASPWTTPPVTEAAGSPDVRLGSAHFVLERVVARPGEPAARDPRGTSVHVLTAVGGRATVRGRGWQETLAALETLVVPADAGAYTIEAVASDPVEGSAAVTVLLARVPTSGERSGAGGLDRGAGRSSTSTLLDVARRAGVSPMTASRVVNASAGVSPKLRARVEQALAETGYMPNTLARSLRARRTDTIALLLPDMTNPFFTTLAHGVEAAAREAGITMILANSDERPDEERRLAHMLLQRRVDGLLITPAGTGAEAIELCRERGVPLVIVDRRPTGSEVDVVRADSRDGAIQLGRLLVELGHRDMAILSGPATVPTAIDRVAGFREAVDMAGLPPPHLFHGAYSIESGHDMAIAAMEVVPRPTAVFAGNNFLAIGAMHAFGELGVRVPEDVAVVGFDDLPEAMVIDPFLTVAVQPAFEMGRQSVAMLLDRLANPHRPPREVVLPVEVVTRRSSGDPIGAAAGRQVLGATRRTGHV